MTADPLVIAIRIASIFERLGMRYVLGGSLANVAFGEPRALVWFRDGGEVSDRQWRDVLGVLKSQGTQLDVPSLDEQASLAGVRELLERALGEAGLASG